jgi:hypothetical protein
MSTTGRQSNLFLAEDWRKIYQTFKNADFQSYDFENLRRVMIQYLREKYPEDFNDYIESSEYLALIDLVAFLGQSLSFRIDLNSRENFLELAERRESILRLAQLISYNPSRNVCANGLLKVESISTSEEILDSNGRNLSAQEILWNDSTNNDWYDQFIKVMNGAMIDENEFGIPLTYDTVGNIYSEQYKTNSNITDLPIFSFGKIIDGRTLPFEAVSTIITDGKIKEETPKKGNKFSIIYRNDYRGFGSINTGWFVHFRQGILINNTFTINSPTTNEVVIIDDININEDDVWLYQLNQSGSEETLWTKVPSTTGNNVIYNSLDKTIKNIYKVQTRSNDAISLQFADGIFGNLPKGSFRSYYRTSNGLTYTINPKDMRGIIINLPYISKKGTNELLKMNLSLKSSVTSASVAESNTEIKKNAPATYYTQNRMITGEDYNLAPLNISQTIAKVKTINRTASGISRNFDLIDASGKYSTISTFCTDGIIYRENVQNSFNFKFKTRTDIDSIIKNSVEPLIKSKMMRDFYYENYNKIILTELNPKFNQVTTAYNETTGYFADTTDGLPFKVGGYTASSLKYIEPGALLKFVAEPGLYFDQTGKLVTEETSTTTDRLWSKVTTVVGDGSAAGYGILSSGYGPIVFNDVIPSGAILNQVIPKFVSNLPTDTESAITELIFNNKNFGLRYDIVTRTWQIIYDRNLNLINNWNLGKTGDNSGLKLDSSWLIAFETDGETYTVTYRGLEYYFESIKENRFFFDGTKKIYDISTGKVKKDTINILKFNTKPNLTTSIGRDYTFEIIGTTAEEEGYASSRTIKITFADSDDDGVVDNPEAFNIIVNSDVTNDNRFVFFEKYITESYIEDYRFVQSISITSAGIEYGVEKFIILQYESDVGSLNGYADGQLFYFYSTDLVKKFDKLLAKLVVTTDYYANIGRSSLKFHYLHNADSSYRIDPSASNIMDTYILTKNYDISFRSWLKGNIDEEPLPPSSTNLKLTYGEGLDAIKSISDELIFHPVKYKVLFGDKANTRLQASFKVVKNKEQVITDNDIKARIIQATNEFFSIDNWDFGDTFFFTELSTYVMNQVAPYITTFLIVPENNDQVYGSLQQITAAPNEIFISGAKVEDIEVIDAITAARIKAQGYIITSSTFDVNTTNLQSSTSSK